MRIRTLRDGFDAQNIDYSMNQTTVYMDVKLQKGKQFCHLVKQTFLHDEWVEDDDEDDFQVHYSLLEFTIDSGDPSPTDISSALANFLARLKLYIYSYEIIKERVYVAYVTPKLESERLWGLEQHPIHRSHCIYLEVYVQPEDGVDYREFLGIKFDKPIGSISYHELAELDLGFRGGNIETYASFSDEDMRKYLSVF